MNDLSQSNWDGKQPLIVFDGVCVLCSGFAKWVIKRDKKKLFLFTFAQSELGKNLYNHFDLDGVEFETNLVIFEGDVFVRMQAFFQICKVLGLPWRLISLLNFLPQTVLNWIYERIKNNRYQIFGKMDDCLIPEGDLKDRFIH